MSALFVALGIMVLALLALLLWFVPHLLQQQATRVAGETTQLREMLLDLLNEQEAVTIRQGQLNASLSNLQDQLSDIASAGNRALAVDQHASRVAENGMQQLEARLGELQGQIKEWTDGRQHGVRQRAAQDNEAWANLMGLLASIQERVGTLSQDRASVMAGLQAGALLEELEQEMQNLRGISEEIEMLQWRLRRSLNERESNLSTLRTRTSNGA
ncbi:MAG: hypothetical protein ABIV47_00720 [Roseiflexaceae bacterium]